MQICIPIRPGLNRPACTKHRESLSFRMKTSIVIETVMERLIIFGQKLKFTFQFNACK